MSDDTTTLDPSVRLRIAPAATRWVGNELLVNVGGATAPVHRLGGIGPYLWNEFVAGRTIGEVADSLQGATRAPAHKIEQVVRDFAAQLVDVDIAEPIP